MFITYRRIVNHQLIPKFGDKAPTEVNGWRVATLVMHVGRPVPEMHSHDATGY